MTAEGMNSIAQNSVLQRKARAARQVQDARAMSPARAVRLSLEKCAADDLGFNLTVTGVEQARLLGEAIAQDFPDPSLIVLLDGPDGAPGAMVLDAQMNAAMVEVQTMGRLSARPAPPRTPTRTDAAIAAPLIPGILTRVSGYLGAEGDWALGYGFGAMIETPRALSLALGPGEHRVLRIGCGLGPDREGEVILILPLPAPIEAEAPPDVAEGGAPPDPAALRGRVMGASVQLETVLTRLQVPLAKLQDLRPGHVFTLAAGALGNAQLEALDGRCVARVYLGQMAGQRAVRLRGLSQEGARAALPAAEAAQDAAHKPAEPTDKAPAQLTSPEPVTEPVDPAEGLPDLSEFGFEENWPALSDGGQDSGSQDSAEDQLTQLAEDTPETLPDVPKRF